MSALPILLTPRRGPILPQELCDMILMALPPQSAWKSRLVCRSWDRFVTNILAPRYYLPNTTLIIRQAQSWVFYNPPASPYLVVESGIASPARSNSSFGGHDGTRFTFFQTGTRNSTFAAFEPPPALSESEKTDLLMKMEDEVQVMVYIEEESFKHIRLPSLSLCDRDTLRLSIEWKELFNATFLMPQALRDKLELSLRPSLTWAAADEDGQPGTWWNVRSPPVSSPEYEPPSEDPPSSQDSWKTCDECDEALFL